MGFIALALSCGSAPDPADPRPGTLVVALRGDPDAWNPYVTEDAATAEILDLLYPRLLRETTSPEGDRFEPWLAESWERASDGLAWTFRIRRDAAWSDGTPVTCEDVRFTLRAQTDPSLAWPGAFFKERILGVDCPDAHTAVFRYREAYANQLLDANDDAIVPARWGEVPFDRWRSTAWHERALTSGPFRLASVAPGQEATLVRDPRWPGAEARPARVVLRVHPDAAAAVRALAAGEIDVVPRLPAAQVAVATAGGAARIVELPSLAFSYLGWNVLEPGAYLAASKSGVDDEALLARLRRDHAHPVLADPNVRRALTLAIDRADLVRGLFGGRARVGNTPIVLPWVETPQAALPFDREAARALLREAGFEDRDGDGVLERGKTRLELRVLLNADNAVRRDAFERIAASLAPLGVRLVADPVPRNAFNARARDKQFDAILAGRVAGTRVEPQATLHSRAAPARGDNVTSWSTPESDARLDRGEWEAWQLIYRDEQPYTVLWVEKTLVGLGPRVPASPPLSTMNPFLEAVRLAPVAH